MSFNNIFLDLAEKSPRCIGCGKRKYGLLVCWACWNKGKALLGTDYVNSGEGAAKIVRLVLPKGKS